MVQLNEMIELYEYMELHKHDYLDLRQKFLSKINNYVQNHDLDSLNNLFCDIKDYTQKNKEMLYSYSDIYRIESIKNAINNESHHKFNLFWNDTKSVDELLDKYNRTIFMIRRLDSELPLPLKQEAHDYLRNISPFIVNAAANDPTVIIAKPDFTYITLAMDFLSNNNYIYPLIYLRFINNKNPEIFGLINQLENIQNNKS